MYTKPILRLELLVAREIKRVGNVNRLAQLINEANAKAGTKLKVDFRTLLKICKTPGKVALTLDILTALNEYFRTLGEGLNKLPILASPGLLEPLADSSRIVFMLGAKARPQERRVDLSRWDARALAELLTRASRFDRKHEFDIEDVLWRSPVDPSALKAENWYSLLDLPQTSVISVGAPVAALSSEVMLARMFGVEPFVRPRFSTKAALPFYFVWLPRVMGRFSSAFGLTWRELQAEFKELSNEVKNNRASAFILDGVPHVVPAEGKTWDMHGIIAAQRRACGSLWLVISGLAGPATLATATLVKQITAELPCSHQQDSPVLWVPVKVRIATGQPSSAVRGDLREIVSAELVGEPRVWPA